MLFLALLMKIDDIDIKILKILGLAELNITTTELAKKLFILKDEYDLKQKDNFIRIRLQKLTKNGLVSVKKEDNHKVYTLHANCLVLSGVPEILIANNSFKGEQGEYIFILKNNHLEQILS